MFPFSSCAQGEYRGPYRKRHTPSPSEFPSWTFCCWRKWVKCSNSRAEGPLKWGIMGMSLTSTAPHPTRTTSTGDRSSLDFDSLCSKFFQETFNHQGSFSKNVCTNSSPREPYCFWILWFPQGGCAQILRFLLMFQRLWVMYSINRFSGQTWLARTVTYSSPFVESQGLRRQPRRVLKSAIINGFQRVADGLANQYDSNGCFCLLYK